MLLAMHDGRGKRHVTVDDSRWTAESANHHLREREIYIYTRSHGTAQSPRRAWAAGIDLYIYLDGASFSMRLRSAASAGQVRPASRSGPRPAGAAGEGDR